MTILHLTLGLVLTQRVVELVWAHRNTVRLRRLGGVEADAKGYPYFVLMHFGWLVSLALLIPADTEPIWPLLGLFAFLQLGRLWVIASLGRYWTTRIVTVSGAPLVCTGPFRWFRHPNYLLVIAEIALLPLAFGAIAIAASFSLFNLIMIIRRMRIEESVLAPRRGRREPQPSWPDMIRPSTCRSCGATTGVDHPVTPGLNGDGPSRAKPGGSDESQIETSVHPEQPW